MAVTRAEELYTQITGRKYTLLLSLAIVVVIVFLVDISVGPAWLSITNIFSAIFTPNSVDPANRFIVWNLRLPMALMAIVVGAFLAIAGAEMQTILNNPLASPYTLGISAAAGFGAALALILGIGIIPHVGQFIIPINAFLFAMLSCFLIYVIAGKVGFGKETMVLTGIAVLFLFQSLLGLLQYLASEEKLQGVVFWMFGSLLKTTWTKLGITTATLLIVIPLLVKNAWKLTALRLGDEKAESLGVNSEKLRLKVFILVSALTGAAVCFVGAIGFIGLVGPHIARMLVGEDQRFFLPTSALAGALLLSAASVVSKLVIPGTILPVGIVTSLIGVPFFVSLILKKRRDSW